MLLKLRIRCFTGAALAVDPVAIAAFQARCGPAAPDLAACLKDSLELLDVESAQRALLPARHADVFISHGAVDRQQVLQLAVMLEQVGLSVYVDSCLWRHVDAVQREMDAGRSTRRRSVDAHPVFPRVPARPSASVCMVVNATLQRLIDGCELFLHLEGESALAEARVDDGQHDGAPWVFSELTFARHLPRRGRPRPVLTGLPSGTGGARALFGPPGAPHVLGWEVLERAIADTTGFPLTSYRDDYPVFLDHLYGKLPLSPQERQLLGWA